MYCTCCIHNLKQYILLTFCISPPFNHHRSVILHHFWLPSVVLVSMRRWSKVSTSYPLSRTRPRLRHKTGQSKDLSLYQQQKESLHRSRSHPCWRKQEPRPWSIHEFTPAHQPCIHGSPRGYLVDFRNGTTSIIQDKAKGWRCGRTSVQGKRWNLKKREKS